jgi:PAS domain S-box-containing protein
MLSCLAAVAAPTLVLLLTLALDRGFGELPPYILFYPVVFLVAAFGGAWAGLLATTTSALLAEFWVLPLREHFVTSRPSDALGLAIFCVMGGGISFVSELYSRNRRKLTGYQNAQALQAERNAADVRYRLLFDSIDEGFCTIEMLFGKNGRPNNWRFLEVNPAFERHIGLANAKGKTIRELVPNVEDRWLDIYEKVGVTGEAVRLVQFTHTFNRWLDLYVFRTGEPEQHRVAVLFTDITERKQAEEALLRSEKLAGAGRMAAAISHELNNPLAAVTNLLFLMKGVEGLPEPARHLLETADAELRQITHITRQALGFYRESTSPSITSVNAVLDSAVDLLKNKVKAKHAVIEKQWDVDVQVNAIAGELRQVFTNLLANSLDAIDERGTIKLRVTATQRHVRITIADDGKGISTESRRQVFDPFFTTKGTTGTGLGLWVSKEIISKHGGIIQMHSREHRGTAVSVILPFVSSTAAEAA